MQIPSARIGDSNLQLQVPGHHDPVAETTVFYQAFLQSALFIFSETLKRLSPLSLQQIPNKGHGADYWGSFASPTQPCEI